MRLQDKMAIVTGAGSGIGKATALLFADEGAKVVVVNCDAAGGERTMAEIERQGRVALLMRADISKDTDAEHLVRETRSSRTRAHVECSSYAVILGLSGNHVD